MIRSLSRLTFFGVLSCAALFPGLAEIHDAHVHADKTEHYARDQAPASGRHYAPSREIDIVHQKLEVTPDFERRGVSGVSRIDFKPIARPIDQLKLDAVDLAVAKVESSAPIIGWQNTGEQLRVTYKDPIPAGMMAWVQITYSAEEPAKGLYFRTPAMGYKAGDTHLWTQGEMHEARHWFPSYDFPNEKFTTEMICHVKEGMVALSNGKLVSQKQDPGTGLVAWHWLQEKPHVNYLVTLCAGYFKKIEDRAGDLPLAFWTPASQIDFAKNSFAGTREMIAFFEKETGVKYPWARYDQVVVDDFTWGGMENTTQTTLTDKTLFPDELRGTRSSLGLVAHELAHQWFGDYVTSKDWSHVWLNEGFATYYEALFRAHYESQDDFLYEMLGNARAVLGQENDVIPIVHRAFKNPEEQFGFRAYPKGSWILHMLRSQLGPDLYRQCVTRYLERHAFATVATEDFVGILEELTGRDWDQFFDQYVYHAHHPELKIDYSWDERTKLAKVSIQQTQKLGPTVLLFSMPLKIRFKTGAMAHDRVAEISKASEDFFFSLPEKPGILRIDPGFGWLAQVEVQLPSEMIHAQLDDPSDMIGRILAVEHLGKRKDPASIDKLKHVLNHDAFWAVRFEAAKALRQIHTTEARAALLASTTQPDARVRRQVGEGIAGYFHAETPAALAKFIDGERNPDIQAAAIRALGAYPTDQVRETLVRHLNSSSYKQVLADAAIDAIRSQGSPVYLDPLLESLAAREQDFTTAGFSDGLRTVATLAAERENRAPFREFLAARLNHPKRGVQLAAIDALGTLGDPQAIPALQTFLSAGKDSPKRKAAENALRRLRERKPQSAEVDLLRGEVLEQQRTSRELRQQLDEIKKRLDAERGGGGEKSPLNTRKRTSAGTGRK